MTRKLIVWGMGILVAFMLAGCGDDGPVIENGRLEDLVLFRPDRLPSLFQGLVYEAWLANRDDDGNWTEQVSLGKFFWDEFDYRFLNSSGNGVQIDSIFHTANFDRVYHYNTIAITLEQHPNDPSADPSPTIVAISDVVPDQVTNMRFPVDFSGVPTGYFSIGTYSDGHWKLAGEPDKALERYGLWFLRLTIPQAVTRPEEEIYRSGLTLPVLPDTGYLYQGWIATSAGDTISTGKFFFPDYIDYDNRYSRQGEIPNFPGEDFLTNRPTWIAPERWPFDCMQGGEAFVTVEPNPDNDLLRPSNFVVVRGNLPSRSATDHLSARATNFPLGSVAGVTFPKIEVIFLKR